MPELDLFAIAALALWAYCIFDVIRTDDSTVQNLPKMIWLLIVIFIPTLGSIAWLLLGRPSRGTWRLSTNASSAPSSPPAPTGHPEPPPVSHEDHQARREEALRRHQEQRAADLQKREEELRIKEEELRRRERDLGESS